MSSQASNQYIYPPLTSPDEFRLVVLHQSGTNPSGGDNFSIEFVPGRFDQACSYVALSYAWGTDPGVEDIQVVGTRLQTLKITKSLACALQSLRKSEHKVLWIDALCIDQTNLSEKSHQIGRMAEIYRRATEVVIWLGDAANQSDLAMDLLNNVSAEKIDNLATDPGAIKAWVALSNLMTRSWFTRRWVVQEVVFARHAVLRCGSATASWLRFCGVVELFVEKLEEIKRTISNSTPEQQPSDLSANLLHFLLAFAGGVLPPLAAVVVSVVNMHTGTIFGPDQITIGELRGIGVHSLIALYDRILPRKRNDTESYRLCTMEALLSYLPESEATDGRDMVFALASLAKDYVGFTPDYKQSVVRVYKNAVQQAAITSRSLNIICRPWAQPSTNLPSWILPNSAFPFRRNWKGIYVRQHADTLVRSAHQRIYQASGSICASASFNDDETKFVLTCRGIQLPTIAWIGDPAAKGSISNLWQDSFEQSNVEHKYFKEIYWRTLVADRDSRGNPPPYWYSLACTDAHKLCPDGGLDTTKLLQDQRKDGEQISNILKNFLARVKAVTWNRRLVRLKDYSLGLVPERTLRFDRICILFGCDVPVVLRKRQNDFWELIGEAFVYGVMDGEAVERPYQDMSFNLI
ncbi:HET-domain-containing protein [Cadophora sp. DSE1049]|nr:HET-domain-containing protein [Cadophora sp. DSE1049]